MFSNNDKNNYTAPVTEVLTVRIETKILNGSGAPGGIPGNTSTTAYDEEEGWN